MESDNFNADFHKFFFFGDDWYRQERSPVCKHVGARLFTPLSNDDQNTNGDNNFALAA